jgi:hypothetical protein
MVSLDSCSSVETTINTLATACLVATSTGSRQQHHLLSPRWMYRRLQLFNCSTITMETWESTTTFLIGFERRDYNENAIPNCRNRQDTKLKISDWISDFLFQVQDANNSITPMPSQEALSAITTRFNPYARPSPRPRSWGFLKKYEIHQLNCGIRASMKSYERELQRHQDNVS